ncbi:uncharacterized protein LOC105694884 [Orussus abietinus]|uniref:uncharacterized protein LOC105694884 n=1 Tax=Orussus abietinus TaxID=222816 RepID=UPI0006269E49|nr:uncharacterized protein LOC105694884 [Orussus abietinus]
MRGRMQGLSLVALLTVALLSLAVEAQARHQAEPRGNHARRHHIRHHHDPRSRRHDDLDPRWRRWKEYDEDYEEDLSKEEDLDARRTSGSRRTSRGHEWSPRSRSHRRGYEKPWYQEEERGVSYPGTGTSYQVGKERSHRGRPQRERSYRRLGYQRRNEDEVENEDERAEVDVDDEGYEGETEDSLEDRYSRSRTHDRGRRHRYEYEDNDGSKRGRPGWRTGQRSQRRSRHREGERSERRPHAGRGMINLTSDQDELGWENEDNDENEEYEDEVEVSRVDAEDADDEDEDANKDEVEDDEDDGFDNSFHGGEVKPPLRTFEDIIKRLTSEDPTTSRPNLKRDYRNIEIERHLKRDAYGNLRYDPKVGKSLPSVTSSSTSSTKLGSASYAYMAPWYIGNKRPVNNTVQRSLEEVRKIPENRKIPKEPKKRPPAKTEDPKAKSAEQDYEDYINAPDNEDEDDLIKAGVEEDMQADTNADYLEDDNEDEEISMTTSTTTTPSTTTSTTTTTTTTTKPPSISRYEHRDPRAYDSGTGSQYNGYQAKNEYPPMSAHSVHKWQSLGTREGVKETRSNLQQYNKSGKAAEIKEALQHAIKVSREGSCQWPRARVIPVRDVYPSPSTTYIPHCAILHRCSDDTGCCRSEALTCVPKNSHRVELYFYTTSVSGASVVEKLSFYNHTECECREKTEHDMSNDKPFEPDYTRHPPPLPPQNIRRPPQRKPCRCPSEFTPRITPEGECQCNCFENDQDCIKARRGKGYFSLRDRLCIQNGECGLPMCEYGEYMRRQGKCPRKRDKFDAIANHHRNLGHRFRR